MDIMEVLHWQGEVVLLDFCLGHGLNKFQLISPKLGWAAQSHNQIGKIVSQASIHTQKIHSSNNAQMKEPHMTFTITNYNHIATQQGRGHCCQNKHKQAFKYLDNQQSLEQCRIQGLAAVVIPAFSTIHFHIPYHNLSLSLCLPTINSSICHTPLTQLF